MLDVIMVCVNYWDYLRHTLPYANKRGRVTVASDSDRDVDCALHVTVTDWGGPHQFAKSNGINAALQAADPQGWVLLTDADMVLPANIETDTLDPRCLYGCARRICASYAEWVKYQQSPSIVATWPLQNNGRVMRHKAAKAGYFQLFHAAAMGEHPWYPHHHTAGRSDARFARRFGGNRRFIDWPVGSHPIELKSEYQRGVWGRDWKGRQTPLFGDSDEI
jgi:hypothetical protein